MPQNYTVWYSSTFGGTLTQLTNVQEIDLFVGRQFQLDAYNASTCRITVRYPTGYASPIAALVPGSYIRLNSPNNPAGGSSAFYYCRIRNVTVNYGIPYSGGVGNADYLYIDCEGGFAAAGRMSGQNYSMAADTITDQLTNMGTQSGLGYGQSGVFNYQLGATTISGTWGDWINSVLVTINGRMEDGNWDKFTIISPYVSSPIGYNFSDTTNNSTNQVYNQVTFGALADNYYTQVTVAPSGLASQTVTTAGAVKPFRTLTMNTLSGTTGQALDQANFLLGQYGQQTFAITSVSCLAEAQNSFQLDNNGGIYNTIGRQTSVTFRGTTYNAVIEGVSMNASPGETVYTYYLSGADLNDYLVLNNAVTGRLNFNRLGY